MDRDLQDLDRRLRRVTLQSRVQLGVLAVVVAAGLAAFVSDEPGKLRVSELVVVDAEGVDRVRISGDLPDAVVDGRRLVRGEKAAGVILYDGAGRERSGYATFEPSGNVLLTLDNRQSEQNALFVAGPDNAAALRLWQGNDAIDLRTDEAGTRLSVVEGGLVRHQTPVTPIPAEVCEAYTAAVASLGRDRVLRECNGRFTAENCTNCLTP
ncbi:hypothetical protein [Brevundimonas sp. UBA7664]|uniref:hypothetical protein n=1 Tax=Brevundimonas sp. UBA7664 TaxID=1946141 RepID=UPI0025C3B9B2|nr:hypothetical protein [Brevundimonas sp. UBA7664]